MNSTWRGHIGLRVVCAIVSLPSFLIWAVLCPVAGSNAIDWSRMSSVDDDHRIFISNASVSLVGLFAIALFALGFLSATRLIMRDRPRPGLYWACLCASGLTVAFLSTILPLRT